MSDSVEHPTHDPSADEELSSSLEGHSELPDGAADSATSASADEELSSSLESHSVLPGEGESSVLDQADDSPVRTKNS